VILNKSPTSVVWPEGNYICARARALNQSKVPPSIGEGNMKFMDIDSGQHNHVKNGSPCSKSPSLLLLEILRVIYSPVNSTSQKKAQI